MTRRLLNLCLAWALVLGCCGGALAAAFCPHADCHTTAAAPEHDATHGAHTSSSVQPATGHEGHSSHAQAHQGHHAQPTAHEQPPSDSKSLTALASSEHQAPCRHCMGSPPAPPATKSEWQLNHTQKTDRDSAAQTANHLLTPARVLVRKIAPSQHAPPTKTGRHLLLNVFLI